MRAFFAMTWDKADPAADAAAGRIIEHLGRRRAEAGLKAPGFLMADLSDHLPGNSLVPVISSGGELAGAVFGTLFERSGGCVDTPVREITGQAADALIAGGGSAAERFCWGSYVAVIRSGARTSVIADPLSSVPCFYWIAEGVLSVFSNLEKCTFLDTRPLTINYEFLAALLRYDKVQTGATGFREIRELCAGERLRREGTNVSTDIVWNPGDVAASPLSGRTIDLSEELRETVLRTVRSWGSVFENIVVNVSGGLDSSIVLASLCESGGRKDVTPLHHILDSEDPGEASYAEDLCAFLGLELRNVRMTASQALPDPCTHPLTARPYRDFVAGSLTDLFGADVLRGADAVFTGQGGDHLFLLSESPLGFTDYILTNGPGPGAWRELFAAARLSGRSVWTVLAEAIRSGGAGHESLMARALRDRAGAAFRLGVVPDTGACLPDPDQPAMALPPAKSDQVSIVPHLVHLRDGMDRSRNLQIIHPLMSQPVLELCLRIPAYELCTGGISRGLARLAFSGLIPESIRQRMTKGHAGMYFSGRLDANQDLLCEALLEGELAAYGLLDRRRLSEVLRGGHHRTMNFGNRLLVFYAIEAWLRSWRRFLSGTARGFQGDSP